MRASRFWPTSKLKFVAELFQIILCLQYWWIRIHEVTRLALSIVCSWCLISGVVSAVLRCSSYSWLAFLVGTFVFGLVVLAGTVVVVFAGTIVLVFRLVCPCQHCRRCLCRHSCPNILVSTQSFWDGASSFVLLALTPLAGDGSEGVKHPSLIGLSLLGERLHHMQEQVAWPND